MKNSKTLLTYRNDGEVRMQTFTDNDEMWAEVKRQSKEDGPEVVSHFAIRSGNPNNDYTVELDTGEDE